MNKRESLSGRMVIADGLRHVREATGISQTRLADLIGKLELELRQLTVAALEGQLCRQQALGDARAVLARGAS